MFNHIKKYVIVTRPWSFTMSLISVSVGTIPAAEEGSVSWAWFAITAIGITLFHATANLINDYFKIIKLKTFPLTFIKLMGLPLFV